MGLMSPTVIRITGFVLVSGTIAFIVAGFIGQTEEQSTGSVDPNPDDPRHAYNYRAWWRAIQQDPERFNPQIDPEDGMLHGPSLFKAAGHPNRFVNIKGREVDTITGQPRQKTPNKPSSLEGMIGAVESRREDRERQRAELVSTPRPTQEPGFFGRRP